MIAFSAKRQCECVLNDFLDLLRKVNKIIEAKSRRISAKSQNKLNAS